MHALTNYNDSGILVVTPENDLSADRQALNDNFKALADAIAAAQAVLATLVPYTGAAHDIDLNGQSITNLGGLAANSGAATSLDGGAIATDGDGNITACKTVTLTPQTYPLLNTGTGITVATGQGSNSYHAVSFPGSAYLSGESLMSGSSPRVLAVAVKVVTENSGTVCGQQNSSIGTTFQLIETSSGWYLNEWGPGDIVDGAVDTTSWHILAAVWDGAASTLYLDGMSVGSSAAAVDTAATPFQIGYNPWPGSYLISCVGDVVLLDGVPGDLSGFLASLYDRWYGTDSFDPTAWGVACTAWFDANTAVTTDGSGNVTNWHARIGPIVVPPPVVGGIYFDGTNFNFCADGSTWVALSLP